MKRRKKQTLGYSPKLLRKYRLVLMDVQTYEEKISLVITRLGVFVVVGLTIVSLIVLTCCLYLAPRIYPWLYRSIFAQTNLQPPAKGRLVGS